MAATGSAGAMAEEPPHRFHCPISFEVMKDPRACRQCGANFDQTSLEPVLQRRQPCPLCKLTPFRPKDLVPNRALAEEIQEWQERAQRPGASPAGQRKVGQTTVIMVGGPGVGKSTLLNSLVREACFDRTAPAPDLPYKLEEVVWGTTRYLETQGLSDRAARKAAAEAIAEVLKNEGHYKVFFVVTLNGGRLGTHDVATLETVLNAAPIAEYGIIINRVCSRLMQRMDVVEDWESPTFAEQVRKSLSDLGVAETAPIFWQEEDFMLDEAGAVWEMPPPLRTFLEQHRGMTVSSGGGARSAQQDKRIGDLQRDMTKMQAQLQAMQAEHERQGRELRHLRRDRDRRPPAGLPPHPLLRAPPQIEALREERRRQHEERERTRSTRRGEVPQLVPARGREASRSPRRRPRSPSPQWWPN